MIKRRSKSPEAGADTANRTPAEAGSDPVAARIGDELRALFDDVVAEPVPEKFRLLLDELERKSGKR